MGHELIQRMWRNKNVWLNSMVQITPIRRHGDTKTAINEAKKKQDREMKFIRKKIEQYEASGCTTEKLTDSI